MFVWCMMAVVMDCGMSDQDAYCQQETSVKGKVLRTTQDFYLVDFSEYAKKQGYKELTNPKMIEKDICIKE